MKFSEIRLFLSCDSNDFMCEFDQFNFGDTLLCNRNKVLRASKYKFQLAYTPSYCTVLVDIILANIMKRQKNNQ